MRECTNFVGILIIVANLTLYANLSGLIAF